MMLRMKREFAGSQNQILPVFDTLLLLDRNVDLLTPLATQLSYEGLIDEIYGITNGQRNLLDLMFIYVFPICNYSNLSLTASASFSCQTCRLREVAP